VLAKHKLLWTHGVDARFSQISAVLITFLYSREYVLPRLPPPPIIPLMHHRFMTNTKSNPWHSGRLKGWIYWSWLCGVGLQQATDWWKPH